LECDIHIPLLRDLRLVLCLLSSAYDKSIIFYLYCHYQENRTVPFFPSNVQMVVPTGVEPVS
ncbi:MAG: hypothetical protein AB1488_01080, partial [Nitrospirota bacterium]